jgi:hypothetical protein
MEKDGQQQRPPQMQENHPGREHEVTPTPSFICSTNKLAGKLKVQLSGYSLYFFSLSSAHCQLCSSFDLCSSLQSKDKKDEHFLYCGILYQWRFTHIESVSWDVN